MYLYIHLHVQLMLYMCLDNIMVYGEVNCCANRTMYAYVCVLAKIVM